MAAENPTARSWRAVWIGAIICVLLGAIFFARGDGDMGAGVLFGCGIMCIFASVKNSDE